MTGLERISGPWRSYWVAAYTVEFGGLRVGYAKISHERPSTVWDDDGYPFMKVSYEALTHEEALEGVESVARSAIARSRQMNLF